MEAIASKYSISLKSFYHDYVGQPLGDQLRLFGFDNNKGGWYQCKQR